MRPESLVDHLGAIVPSPLRVPALVTAWTEQAPRPWVTALAHVLRRAHVHDDVAAWTALEAIILAAASTRLPYPARAALYAAAMEVEAGPVARCFLAAGPPTVSPDQLRRQLAPERVLRPRGRPITLGERKSLARSFSRELLALVVRDPHPDVVAIFLDNTHVTEADVVRVAAARPAVPSALVAIALHPRWGCRQVVKRALVWNPALPLPDGVRIATTLRPLELRQLVDAASQPAPLRAHAAELLTWARG